MHPDTGRLYGVEHGPRGGDEINLVEKGNNYGWPEVSYAINYNGNPFGHQAPFHEDAGYVEPVHYWLPSIALCGTSFYVGDQFPQWRGDLFVAALAKQEVHRVRFSEDGRSVIEDEVLFRGFGRVRDVAPGPDGYLYIATEQPGMIRRLVPKR
jgi:glucose/arabinose dehydrogenase